MIKSIYKARKDTFNVPFRLFALFDVSNKTNINVLLKTIKY
jgi:hypothetical protein